MNYFRYPHRPAGVSSHNSSQLRSPITSEGYSGDKNRTGISPDTTTKDDNNMQLHQQQLNLQQSRNHSYQPQPQRNQNTIPSPHQYSNQQQGGPMRSPQQVHSSGMLGQPPGRIPQQNNTTPASFLAYSAGDVASTATNRIPQNIGNQPQGGNYNNSINKQHSMSNSQSPGGRGANPYSTYNSNISLPSSSGSSKTMSSNTSSDASRNAMTHQNLGGDTSRMNDNRSNDAVKTYSALDRTASALPNNMNYHQSMLPPARNAPSSLPENNSRFSPQNTNISSQSNSSNAPSNHHPSLQQHRMPIPNYQTNNLVSSNPQLNYQQQRQMPSPQQQQNLHQQPQQQLQPPQPNLQHQNYSSSRPFPQSNISSSNAPVMSPNQIQPISRTSHLPEQQSSAAMSRPMQQQQNLQQQQRFDNKSNANPQSLPHGGEIPRNIPMLALQQQKVRKT